MLTGKTERWLPLTGLAAGLLLFVALLTTSDTPQASDGVAKVAAYYAEHDGDMTRTTIMLAVSGLLLLLFAGALRSALARGEGPAPTWSNIAFGGVAVYSAGVFIQASLSLSFADLPANVQPGVVQAVNIVAGGMFLPILGGSIIMLLGSAAAILRGQGLPRWLGWTALALAVIGPTPIGFFSFLLGMLWMAAASIVITLAARRPATPGTRAEAAH